MSFVELNIDEDNCQFVISGDIAQILKNRRARYFFLDVLKASFHDIGSPEEKLFIVLIDKQSVSLLLINTSYSQRKIYEGY